jgi:enoyl-CoA hydratase/carnithine racemase
MASNRLAQVQNHLAPSSDSPNLVLVSYSADGRVVTITINNARRANCLSTPVMKALLAALRSINPDVIIDASIDREDPIEFATRVCRSHAPKPVPKVVVLKTAGKIFCSGHDLREFHGDYKTIHEIFELCNTMMLTIQRLPQIVVSQVPKPLCFQDGDSIVRFKECAQRRERN